MSLDSKTALHISRTFNLDSLLRWPGCLMGNGLDLKVVCAMVVVENYFLRLITLQQSWYVYVQQVNFQSLSIYNIAMENRMLHSVFGSVQGWALW